MLRLLTDRCISFRKPSGDVAHPMQIGSIARWLKGESRVWEGQHFTVATEGLKEGKARDVVFVHGLAASPECWEGASERLGMGVRSHFLHMRGFAGLPPSGFRSPGDFLKPMADALAGYIRLQRAGPMAVVGHSMGGILSLILARDHPDVVDRLMVVDVPAFFSVLINPFATVSSVAHLAEASRRNYVEKTRQQLEDDLSRATGKLVTDPQHAHRIVRWALASDRETTADVMAEVMLTDLRGDLHRIKALVDVIYAWDKQGHMTRMALEQVYAAAYAGLSQGRRLRIDHARHYVMLDQPDAFYQAVQDWLAR